MSEVEMVCCSWVLSQVAWLCKAYPLSLARSSSVTLPVYPWVVCARPSQVPSCGHGFCKQQHLAWGLVGGSGLYLGGGSVLTCTPIDTGLLVPQERRKARIFKEQNKLKTTLTSLTVPVISPSFFLMTSEVFTVSDSMVFCKGKKNTPVMTVDFLEKKKIKKEHAFTPFRL